MNFTSLIYDKDSGAWLSFRNCQELLLATNPEEVYPLLEAVEARASAGKYVVGFVSYEAASGFDTCLEHHPASDLPLAAFGVFDKAEPGVPSAELAEAIELSSVIAREDFSEAIKSIRDYLHAGDSYQVNFTHRLTGHCAATPERVFARLYRAQPSDYAALITLGHHSICSVSPELFFETRDHESGGQHIRTEPMKGTRPRGRHTLEDQALRTELADSAKDQAENLMIVDMIRNDLGRLATPGSVQVDELFLINRLPTVWQKVSSVSAVTHSTLAEKFAALFPCASVTGAPRRRAMEIIAELEDTPRGVYTGAIGVVKPGGEARFSVAIRTLLLDHQAQRAIYGVGGGIVWDSDADEEWQESLLKGQVLSHRVPEFDLLETLRYEPGEGIYLIQEHLERLQGSAKYFGYPFDLAGATRQLKQVSGESPLRLRLLLSEEGEIRLERFDVVAPPAVARLKLAALPVRSDDVFLFHKTTHRQAYDDAMAAVADCDDVILWNERGELTETTICNLFLEIDDELLTPALDSGLLAGTYRRHMLATGLAREAVLYKSDLDRARRIFVANSVRKLVPAVLI